MRNLLTAVGLATLITAMFISPPVAGAVIVVGTLAAVLVGLRNTDDDPIGQRAQKRRVGLRRAWRDFRGANTVSRPSGYPRALFARLRRPRDLLTVIRREGQPSDAVTGTPSVTKAGNPMKFCSWCDKAATRSTSWQGDTWQGPQIMREHACDEHADHLDVYPKDPADLLDPEISEPQQEVPDMRSIGTGGRASIAGLVTDWETSVEAREHPETFVAWLHAQATAARQRAQMVPDLVAQYHGRGPSGHAGVPDQQIVEFSKGYEESASAEADAYDRWAGQYAAYVEAAEEQMTHEFGREVIGSAHAAHRG